MSAATSRARMGNYDQARDVMIPGPAAAAPSLPFQTATTQAASSPITTVPTSIGTQQDC